MLREFKLYASLLLTILCSALAESEPTLVEYVANVKLNSQDDFMKLVNNGISVDHPHHFDKTMTIEAYLYTKRDLTTLEGLGLEFKYQENDHVHQSRRRDVQESADPWAAHHNYQKMTAFLQDIAARFPAITKLISLGQSVQKRELWLLEISDNVDSNEAEPEFKYTANMHGDEVVGRELCLRLIDLMTQEYGKSERITQLIDNTHIYIIPSMNPDGYEAGMRANAKGQDLNRNFPDQFIDRIDTFNRRQPETVAMMKHIQSRHFVLSANYHGGAVVANYPWDGLTSGSEWGQAYHGCPDDKIFRKICLVYSNAHTTMNKSQEFKDGVTNGADWYALYGGMQDYHYAYNHGAMEITLEVSDVKYPEPQYLPAYWNENKEAMLKYMELVHTTGIRGIVTSKDGRPLNARITVDPIPTAVVTDPENGDYYRLLAEGTYNVTAAAMGYKSSTVTGVNIPADQTKQIWVPFTLEML